MPRRPAGTSVGVPVTDSTHRRRSEGIARCPGGRGSPGQPFPDSICQRHRRLRRRPQPTCGRTFCALRLAQRVSGLPSPVSVSVSVSVSGLQAPDSRLRAWGSRLRAWGSRLGAPGLKLQPCALALAARSSTSRLQIRTRLQREPRGPRCNCLATPPSPARARFSCPRRRAKRPAAARRPAPAPPSACPTRRPARAPGPRSPGTAPP